MQSSKDKAGGDLAATLLKVSSLEEEVKAKNADIKTLKDAKTAAENLVSKQKEEGAKQLRASNMELDEKREKLMVLEKELKEYCGLIFA